MKILLATQDLELGLLRAKVLELAGHEVEIGVTGQQILALLTSRKYDLLLVCHSLAEDTCQEAARAFRAMNRDGHVVGIVKNEWNDDSCGLQKFDARVSGINGPNALLSTIGHVGTQSAGLP